MSLNMNHNTNCACDEHVVAVPTEVLQIGAASAEAASAEAASAVQSSEPKWTLGTGGPECSPGCRCIWGGRCSDREPREIFATPFLGGGDATPFLGGGGGDATPCLGGGAAAAAVAAEKIDCRYGNACSRNSCTFKHAPDHVTKVADCRKGNACPFPKCTFKHPVDWNPFANIDCRVADACGNRDCRYKHVADHDYRKNVACGYKEGCKNGKCPFKHSATWNPRANINCNFGPECTKKTTTCKFKHE